MRPHTRRSAAHTANVVAELPVDASGAAGLDTFPAWLPPGNPAPVAVADGPLVVVDESATVVELELLLELELLVLELELELLLLLELELELLLLELGPGTSSSITS